MAYYYGNCAYGNYDTGGNVIYTASTSPTGGNVYYGNQPFDCYSTGGNQTVTYATASNDIVYWAVWNEQYQLTQDQQRLMIEQQQQQIEAARLQAEKHKNAEANAEALLFMFLTEEQKKQYKEKGYFETEANDTKYRIHKGRAGNIRKLDRDGKPVTQLCVHPLEYLPDSDNVLAQFLALQTDAAALERIANHTRLA